MGPHFFRHEYGRLVAMLTRRVGSRHLEAIEDAVQHALLAAVEAWPRAGEPDNPPAWLYRVASNHLAGDLRQRARRRRLLAEHVPSLDERSHESRAGLASDIDDDVLRLLFVCCDPAIPIESQLILAMKTLCGLGVGEIAGRLFLTEETVYKRLARARARLRTRPLDVDTPPASELGARLTAVQAILYLMFTEGYLSSHADQAIRRELCDDATRLATHLAEHPVGATPTTFALVALMHFHGARIGARQDGLGGLLLLDEQDRARWDQQQIATGLAWLSRSAQGTSFSRFHAEAGIAAEHCLAPSLAATRWDRIAESYALLEAQTPSPLHTLGRALAIAEWQGPAAGLAVLTGLEPPTWLAGSYMWSAVLADLRQRCGHADLARSHRDAALALAPSESIRATLERRWPGAAGS